MAAGCTAEDDRQLALLGEPVAVAGSGMVRYAAAMYFYNRGMIGDEALEVYRVCAKIDHEDPTVTLRRFGGAIERWRSETI